MVSSYNLHGFNIKFGDFFLVSLTALLSIVCMLSNFSISILASIFFLVNYFAVAYAMSAVFFIFHFHLSLSCDKLYYKSWIIIYKTMISSSY